MDVDGDGDLDLIVGTVGPERLLLNDGHGLFRERTRAHFPEVLDPSLDVAWGDLDSDGDLDVAVANSDPGGAERLYFLWRRPHF